MLVPLAVKEIVENMGKMLFFNPIADRLKMFSTFIER